MNHKKNQRNGLNTVIVKKRIREYDTCEPEKQAREYAARETKIERMHGDLKEDEHRYENYKICICKINR